MAIFADGFLNEAMADVSVVVIFKALPGQPSCDVKQGERKINPNIVLSYNLCTRAYL